jgi:hypothetical protein
MAKGAESQARREEGAGLPPVTDEQQRLRFCERARRWEDLRTRPSPDVGSLGFEMNELGSVRTFRDESCAVRPRPLSRPAP